MGEELLEGCNVATLNVAEHIFVVCGVRRRGGLRGKSFVVAVSSKRPLTSKIVMRYKGQDELEQLFSCRGVCYLLAGLEVSRGSISRSSVVKFFIYITGAFKELY